MAFIPLFAGEKGLSELGRQSVDSFRAGTEANNASRSFLTGLARTGAERSIAKEEADLNRQQIAAQEREAAERNKILNRQVDVEEKRFTYERDEMKRRREAAFGRIKAASEALKVEEGKLPEEMKRLQSQIDSRDAEIAAATKELPNLAKDPAAQELKKAEIARLKGERRQFEVALTRVDGPINAQKKALQELAISNGFIFNPVTYTLSDALGELDIPVPNLPMMAGGTAAAEKPASPPVFGGGDVSMFMPGAPRIGGGSLDLPGGISLGGASGPFPVTPVARNPLMGGVNAVGGNPSPFPSSSTLTFPSGIRLGGLGLPPQAAAPPPPTPVATPFPVEPQAQPTPPTPQRIPLVAPGGYGGGGSTFGVPRPPGLIPPTTGYSGGTTGGQSLFGMSRPQEFYTFANRVLDILTAEHPEAAGNPSLEAELKRQAVEAARRQFGY